MAEPQKSRLLAEGKTKKIWSVKKNPTSVIVKSKNDITKNDNSAETRIMGKKAELSTTTTCAIFKLLKDAGIPVAFDKQLSPTEFLAPKVKMIHLEIVWRRYAVGSCLNRNPELAKPKGSPPFRFHRAVFELFLKTTKGKVMNKNGKLCLRTPRDEDTGRYIDDPLISDPHFAWWYLQHPKYPHWEVRSILDRNLSPASILPKKITVERIEKLLREVCLMLEGAWAGLGFRFIDIKIEMGVTKDGQLVVADVIDADSWRLRDANWNELSKQLFRDNARMDQIAEKYALIAQLVKQFRIPKQAIVVWRGSTEDPIPKIPEIEGVEVVDIVKSGHKFPNNCLSKLEEVLTAYPDGGVILANVGMSDGLGPVLAARTNWPVIGVVISANEHPEDVWSNLRMPSQVPMATMLSPKNAVLMALNILAQKNPVAYMHRQYAIEELDK